VSRNISEPERSVAHAITDIDGRFLSVDDSFCEILRRERHDVLGQTILNLTAEEYRPINAEKLDHLREAGTSFVIRKTYLRGDGGMQPVENMVSLLRNGAGPSVLAATITPQETARDAGLVAGLAIARLLLRERRARAPSGLVWRDDDLALLLAAYVLETEGSPIWAVNLAQAGGGDERENLLRV
jgi:PAS domain S-box-containing protein